MLGTGELAAMRAAVLRTLPDTCEIQRATRVEDDAGGWLDVYAPITTVACRLAPAEAGAVEQVVAGRLQGRVPVSVTLPHDADLTAADRIQRVGDATALEVLGVTAGGSWAVSARALCARVS